MIRIRSSDQYLQIEDAAIRNLVQKRFIEICDGEIYDAEIHGEIIVVDPGDTLASLEVQSGNSISINPFDNSRFPDPNFVPACEVIEEHRMCYEIVFVLNDDGFGVLIFVPKQPNIDRDLLALCGTYATEVVKRRR